VAPGTYVENINFLGKAITVTGEAGPPVTIIDGNHYDSVVTFVSGEGVASVLSRFTVRNGFRIEGAGILIGASSPTIRENIIRDNSGASAIGINSSFGSPIIDHNVITNNLQASMFTAGFGGGIGVTGSGHAQITNNVISNNIIRGGNGGGIGFFAAGFPIVRNNIISGNSVLYNSSGDGGGISIENSGAEMVVQNLIIKNKAENGGGISWANPGILIDNTIADNSAAFGSGVFAQVFVQQSQVINDIIVGAPGQAAVYCAGLRDDLGVPVFKFNDVFSPQGQAYGGFCQDKTGMDGNVSADALFVNPLAGDYHLRPRSPCIDTGDNSAPDLPATDLDGKPRIQDGNGDGIAVVDMGAYEAPAPFDICIQDDSNGNILRINLTTGDYQFTNCSGITFTGTGGLTKRGSTITVQQYTGDRRVLVRIDSGVNRATAYIQAQGVTFSITDRNTADDTCACAAP
jgi:serine protease